MSFRGLVVGSNCKSFIISTNVKKTNYLVHLTYKGGEFNLPDIYQSAHSHHNGKKILKNPKNSIFCIFKNFNFLDFFANLNFGLSCKGFDVLSCTTNKSHRLALFILSSKEEILELEDSFQLHRKQIQHTVVINDSEMYSLSKDKTLKLIQIEPPAYIGD